MNNSSLNIVGDKTIPGTASSVESGVRDRYSAAAGAREESLCCPVNYRAELLDIIPAEVLERDYGCGDPSLFVQAGDTVLDLGSGGGKICFMAAQIVGNKGRVIGVDCNSSMLEMARRNQPLVAKKLGYDNVEFRCGMIQDLGLNLELLAQKLTDITESCVDRLLKQRDIEDTLRRAKPLVESDSIDCVVSNCVLNLVRQADRQQMFAEIFRVLKQGGRAAISDIVSDEDIPQHMRDDANLWSGCISGAWREDEFIAEFERAGFYGIRIAVRQAEPWQTVEGIEFRAITVVGYKDEDGKCLERNQAVIYAGPFDSVIDEDGRSYYRGQRAAVCDRTFRKLQKAPYEGMFLPVEPRLQVPPDSATEFDCTEDRLRDPRETKGTNCGESRSDCCGSESCC